jgi:uncharacterized damage-inducible protein DinB
MTEVSQSFLEKSRTFLGSDYLPKIERCVGKLTDDQVWWRPNAESNSIGNILMHLNGNVRQWIVSGLGGATDTRVRQDEFDQKEIIAQSALLNRLRQTVNEACDVLSGLEESDLLEKRRIQGYDVTVLDAVYHVVEHFAMHAGQVVYLTKLLTGSDLRFYDL